MKKPKKYRIALISAIPSEQSFMSFYLDFKRSCESMGIGVDLFKNGEFCYYLQKDEIRLYYGDRLIEPRDYGLVFTRLAIKAAHGGDYYAIRLFERKGIPIMNPPDALMRAKNKLHTLEILAHAGLPVTPTAVVRTRKQIAQALELLGSPPYIVKNCFGSKGKAILLASTAAQVYAIFDYLWELDRNEILLLQPYLGQNPICDIRALYVDYSPWRAILRKAPEGEFRTNVHIGASCSPIDLTPREEKICQKAVQILGLSFAGIDFLRTPQGPVILEINGCPGMEGLREAYLSEGIDLVSELSKRLSEYLARFS